MADKMSEGFLHELFFCSAKNFPDNTAVTFSGETIQTLTYRELGESVENFSSCFKKIISKNEVVGIYCHDCVIMPALLLAVMDASAAFYPISTQLQPLKVLESISYRSMRYILVENRLLQDILNLCKRDSTLGITLDILEIDLTNLLKKVDFTILKVAERNEPRVVNWSKRLAYVMQTSGTTGHPKAVFVPHSCIVPNILHLSSIFDVTSHDVVFLASPYTFDPSIVQMFLAFKNGAELLIISEEKKLIPEVLCQTLFDRHQVTVLQPTPSLLYYIGEDLLGAKLLSKTSTLSVLAMGGESCPSLADLRKWKHPECKTKLFNIYGITEVSSWATCHHITDDELGVNGDGDQIGISNVSELGNALSHTKLAVYDDGGSLVIENGVGHLWIGGKDRQCLLEGEAEESIPIMRDSGDIVQMTNSRMWYLGRSNNQIKRFGQKINLDYIERIIREATEVTACTLVLESVSSFGTLLHLYAVPKLFEKRTAEELEKYKIALLERIGELLPKVSRPDHVHLVSKLPLTSHGKVDKREILRGTSGCRPRCESNLSVVEVLSELWLSTIDHSLDGPSINKAIDLGQRAMPLKKPLSSLSPLSAYVKPGDMFMLRGGDSFLAVHLAGRIEIWIRNHFSRPVDLSKLFEIITNKNFGFLVNYIQTMLQSSDVENFLPIKCAAGKRSPKEDFQPTAKMLKSDFHLTNTEKALCACFAKRGSELYACTLCETHSGCSLSLPKSTSKSSVHELSLKWNVYLEKCVDASPLVAPSCFTGEGTVFIGSHSHLFLSVTLAKGEVLWRTRLADRIESSGCLSLCGRLVIVGCYDGKVYLLARDNGNIVWTYQTHDVVKSSPCVDLKTGLIWVGSHDGYLYGLDVNRKECRMRVNCREGSCFSSPAISYDPHHVYMGTLAGYFLCIDAVSGDIKWFRKLEKPIFSSPLIQGNIIFVATVNGCLRCLNHCGDDVWAFNTDALIFSSPLGYRRKELVSVNDNVILASHGQKVYCISSEGKRKWSTLVDSPVYATPCFVYCNYDSSLQESSMPALCSLHNSRVVIVTTKGTIYLLAASDGGILKTFTLPGEIFSSPVIVGDNIVIGCRNDYLYCLKVI